MIHTCTCKYITCIYSLPKPIIIMVTCTCVCILNCGVGHVHVHVCPFFEST